MKLTDAKQNSRSWLSEFGPVCCGRIVKIDNDAQAYVQFLGNGEEPIAARWLNVAGLSAHHSLLSLPVLLIFENGDPSKPIIAGVVESTCPVAAPAAHVVNLDGQEVLIRGRQ